jgi:hypothetical protein
MGAKINIGFNGPVTYFLGIKFTTKVHKSGDISIQLSQVAFINSLVLVQVLMVMKSLSLTHNQV